MEGERKGTLMMLEFVLAHPNPNRGRMGDIEKAKMSLHQSHDERRMDKKMFCGGDRHGAGLPSRHERNKRIRNKPTR